jgi:hypothetical protein
MRAAGLSEHLAAQGGPLRQDPAVEAALLLGRWLWLGQAEAPARQEPRSIERGRAWRARFIWKT